MPMYGTGSDSLPPCVAGLDVGDVQFEILLAAGRLDELGIDAPRCAFQAAELNLDRRRDAGDAVLGGLNPNRAAAVVGHPLQERTAELLIQGIAGHIPIKLDRAHVHRLAISRRVLAHVHFRVIPGAVGRVVREQSRRPDFRPGSPCACGRPSRRNIDRATPDTAGRPDRARDQIDFGISLPPESAANCRSGRRRRKCASGRARSRRTRNRRHDTCGPRRRADRTANLGIPATDVAEVRSSRSVRLHAQPFRVCRHAAWLNKGTCTGPI